MVTLKDIAEKSNVSLMTVSNAINGNTHKMKKDTYEKIMAIIDELNYVPSASARSLTLNKSNIIALWLPSGGEISLLEIPYNSYIVGAIEKYVNSYGYSLMLLSTPSVEEFINQLTSWNIDGGIGVGIYPDDAEYVHQHYKKSFVFIDSYFDIEDAYSIRTNDYRGGYLATKYLLERGHRKIAIVSGDELFDKNELEGNGVLYTRYKGYMKALEENDIFEPLLYGEKIDYGSGVNIGKRIAQQTEVTAFFCTADILAAGVIEGIKLSGKKVPDDYSVVGFDDLPISVHVSPKLTTVRQDHKSKGKQAVNMLVDSIKHKKIIEKDYIYDVELIKRETVKDVN